MACSIGDVHSYILLLVQREVLHLCTIAHQLVSFGCFAGKYQRKHTQVNTIHTTIQQLKQIAHSVIYCDVLLHHRKFQNWTWLVE